MTIVDDEQYSNISERSRGEMLQSLDVRVKHPYNGGERNLSVDFEGVEDNESVDT